MLLQHPLAAVAPTLGTSVLSVLAGADTSFTVTRIHNVLEQKVSPTGIRKALAPLVAQGLVSEVVLGKTHAYSLNRRHLLAEPLLAMTNAKERLLVKIETLVESWPIQPVAVTLFGSAARGDMHFDSDIDILVVFPDDASQDVVDEVVYSLAEQVTGWTGNDVRPLVYRTAEVTPAPIFDSIVSEGITVAGDSNWLRRTLRRQRAAS